MAKGQASVGHRPCHPERINPDCPSPAVRMAELFLEIDEWMLRPRCPDDEDVERVKRELGEIERQLARRNDAIEPGGDGD